MFYEEWGLERALWEETHKGACSAAASKKKLIPEAAFGVENTNFGLLQ